MHSHEFMQVKACTASVTSIWSHQWNLISSSLQVFLPWVGRDGRLRHSRPDSTVDWPSTTPEVSSSNGRGCGGSSSGSCGVGEARY